MDQNEKIVEVIEDGKIVKVTEAYALAENLPIIRRSRSLEVKERVAEISEKKQREMEELKRRKMLDNFNRPINWRDNSVIADLVPNFNWIVARERKIRGLTRKQLAQMINEKEEVVKAIEYGTLPSNDFVVVNKLQVALGINIRKDGKNYNIPMREILDKAETKPQQKKDYNKILDQKKVKEADEFIGAEIEIIDEDLKK